MAEEEKYIDVAQESTLQEILRKIDTIRQTAYRPDKYLRFVETSKTVLISSEKTIKQDDGSVIIATFTVPDNCCKLELEGSIKVGSLGYNASIFLYHSETDKLYLTGYSSAMKAENVVANASGTTPGVNVYSTGSLTFYGSDFQPGQKLYVKMSAAGSGSSTCTTNNVSVTFHLFEEFVTDEEFEVGSLKHHLHNSTSYNYVPLDYYPRLDRCEWGKFYYNNSDYLKTTTMFGTEYVLLLPPFSYLRIHY